jgi:hypothetical protein
MSQLPAASHDFLERLVRVVRGREHRTCRLSWSASHRDDGYQVALDGPDQPLSATGRDLFEALAAVRCQLEAVGWLIAVQGARRDTYPSGMLRDMGGARRVYVLVPGRPVSTADTVDTFADADPADLGTVDAQRQHYQAWRGSLPRS